MSYDTVNPTSGQVEHTQQTMDAAAIEARLAASAKAFPAWAALPLGERGALLRCVGEELTKRRDDLQRIMTAEMGKLRREALAEVDKCAQACAYYAEHAAAYLAPRDIPTEAQSSYVRYEPLGCVFAVMPWNFPLWQAFRFLAPSLMAGNVSLLKHASNVPRCADAMKEVLDAAGIPPGVFDVLHIDNDQAADVVRDDRIAAVTLTGSERAGRSLAANAGDQLKKCVMELGGSDAFVVLEDADLEHTVQSAVQSRFDNSGQTCIAAKRFIVVDAIADQFIERFVAVGSQARRRRPAAREHHTGADGACRPARRTAQAGAGQRGEGCQGLAGRRTGRRLACRLSGDDPRQCRTWHAGIRRRVLRPGRLDHSGC